VRTTHGSEVLKVMRNDEHMWVQTLWVFNLKV
jgi:hypothetical protein